MQFPTGEDRIRTHQIHVPGARQRVHEIRNDLFALSEVLDVFVTGRPDVLVVVHAGRPRPGEWLRPLRRLEYQMPAGGQATWSGPEPRHEELRERRHAA
jgi:hypothetical protein